MKILRYTVGAIALAALASCKSGTAPVTSTVISVIITPSTTALKPGQQVQLRATVAGPPGIPQGVTWRSIDPAIATVSSTGLVKAVAEGSALIRATWIEDSEEFGNATIIVTSTPITDGQPLAGVRLPPRVE